MKFDTDDLKQKGIGYAESTWDKYKVYVYVGVAALVAGGIAAAVLVH